MCQLGRVDMDVKGTFTGPAEEYFKSLGIKHTCIEDVADLCKPLRQRHENQYHMVVDFRAIERLENQYQCFLNIHKMCRQDGLMIHSIPTPGHWPGKSRFYYSKEFFDQLSRANRYMLMFLGYIAHRDIPQSGLTCAMLRKTTDAVFIGRDAFNAFPLDEKEFTEEAIEVVTKRSGLAGMLDRFRGNKSNRSV